MRPIVRCVLLATTIACVLPAAHAQWKWRDAQGRVTVSDRPPPSDVPDKNILTRPPGAERKDAAQAAKRVVTQTGEQDATAGEGPAPAPAPSVAPKDRPGVDPELEARRKKAEQETLAKQKEAEDKQAAQMKDNCARAKSNLASLETGQRISRANDKGEREVLDDAQRAAEIARARDVIAANCK